MTDTAQLLQALQEIITMQEGEEYIRDENDIFHLEKPSTWSLGSLAKALPSSTKDNSEGEQDADSEDQDKILDYDKVIKRLVIHDKDQPESKDTPYFNHQAFFANLKHYESQSRETDGTFGKSLLYGEVVTSTNTLLEKYLPSQNPNPAKLTLAGTPRY